MSEKQKKNYKKTPEQLEILQSYYDQGMTNYRTDNLEARSLLSEAVIKTSLSESQVKHWIDSKKKKPTEKVKIRTRKARGVDIFKSEYMQDAKKNEEMYNPNEALTRATIEWNLLSSDEKENYNSRAVDIIPPKFDELSAEAQKVKISMTRRKIIALCKEMESYGVDLLVLEADKERRGKNITAYGSEKAYDFWDNHDDLEWEFSCFMNGVSTKENRPLLSERKEVANLLNNRFRCMKIATRSTVPYKQISEGLFEVRGLPNGFYFKKPSACAIWELDLLKQHMDDITFMKCRPANVSSNDHQVMLQKMYRQLCRQLFRQMLRQMKEHQTTTKYRPRN
ncbi:uncharacterized protein [Clytia hemisphaerica]